MNFSITTWFRALFSFKLNSWKSNWIFKSRRNKKVFPLANSLVSFVNFQKFGFEYGQHTDLHMAISIISTKLLHLKNSLHSTYLYEKLETFLNPICLENAIESVSHCMWVSFCMQRESWLVTISYPCILNNQQTKPTPLNEVDTCRKVTETVCNMANWKKERERVESV